MTLDRFFSGMVFCLAIILLSSGCGKGDEKSLDLETLRLSLDEGWEFSTIDSSNWLPAEIPGVVHADLIRNHQIPNPYFRLNEMEVQWVEYQTWVYRCTFHVHEELLRREKVSLVLPGLDSHADISLNGKPVPFPGDPDFRKNTPRNMFRTWTYEVKSYLNPGENQIEITFHPLIQSTQVARDTLGYALPADNDASEEKASIFVRKAPYHFGWDWGPRLVTAGIWKTPYLEAWDGTEILDWSFVTKSITTDAAEAELEVHIQAKRPGNFSLEGSIGEQVIDRRLALSADPMRVRIPLTIQDPQLWWPQGSGEPYLYPLNLKLKKGYRVLDEIQAQIGIRTVELIRETDEIGESFYFEVNGEPIYMKGANYIPGDPLLLGKDDERYRQVLLDAAKSNMNMIRVWGGGIYETDGFYDLCDSLGLMVWQDFMFACSMYPGDPEFRENVKAEAEENIIRIRNHPSLALWCGNNEMEVAWFNWGWQQTYKLTPEDSTRIWNDYLYLFEELLPTAVRTFDPNTDYLPSSPVSNWGKAENFNYGDNHYWGVWHGEEPFAEYRYNVPRFMSEYGFQSFPEIHTLLIFSTWDDFDLESEVMTDRQKSYKGNGLLMDYLNRHFDPPADFEEFVHLNQLVQAEGVALAIKTHRKRKPHCMGTLYWQLNDAWPGPSWSGIDYAGRWKAMQYRVRDLYKPVVILPDMDPEGRMSVHLVSDLREAVELDWEIRLLDFAGTENWKENGKARIENRESKLVWEKKLTEILSGEDHRNQLLECRVSRNGEVLSRELLYFAPVKDLKLADHKVDVDLWAYPGQAKVTLRSDGLVKGVFLYFIGQRGVFLDNYFDLLPGEEKVIEFQGDFDGALQVRSINGITADEFTPKF